MLLALVNAALDQHGAETLTEADLDGGSALAASARMAWDAAWAELLTMAQWGWASRTIQLGAAQGDAVMDGEWSRYPLPADCSRVVAVTTTADRFAQPVRVRRYEGCLAVRSGGRTLYLTYISGAPPASVPDYIRSLLIALLAAWLAQPVTGSAAEAGRWRGIVEHLKPPAIAADIDGEGGDELRLESSWADRLMAGADLDGRAGRVGLWSVDA